MNDRNNLSRRNFLQSTGVLSAAGYLRLTTPSLVAIAQSACSAKQDLAAYRVLGESEAADVAAIAARIIPTTDTPGATEAGVVYFFDNAFADEMRGRFHAARDGLTEFNAALADTYASINHFHDLEEQEQDAFLVTRETTDFFNLMWLMTIVGFFSMSKYGGNKDHVGWELIGFEGHRGAWQYPFGHYDAEVHGGTSDGE